MKTATAIDRDRLRALLARAVEDGALSSDRAEAILTAWDAGAIDGEDVESAIEERGDDGSVLLLATAAALYLSSLPAKWSWEPATARYVSATRANVILHPAVVRREVDRVMSGALRRAPEFPEFPTQPRIRPMTPERAALERWRLAIESDLAALHHAAGAAARGGLAQMSTVDRVAVRERILSEYGYLDGFVAEIQAGLDAGRPMSAGAIAARLGQYYEAPRATYEAMHREAQAAAGYSRERNLLGVAEHCRQCPELTAQGWVPIHTLPEPGTRTCLRRCRCRMEYTRAA